MTWTEAKRKEKFGKKFNFYVKFGLFIMFLSVFGGGIILFLIGLAIVFQGFRVYKKYSSPIKKSKKKPKKEKKNLKKISKIVTIVSIFIIGIGIFFFLNFIGSLEDDYIYIMPEEPSSIRNQEILELPKIVDNSGKLDVKTIVYSDEDISEQLYQEEEIDVRKKVAREFNWNYGGYEWQFSLSLYDDIYDFYSKRSREREYDLFVSDSFDDIFITELTDALTDLGIENELEDWEIPYFVTSFVQSLPYTSDDFTTGYDEYPRFPYETIYDNGGDCEDTSILTAALLRELGYGVILIKLPGHMAVGVKGSNLPGAYYTYEGKKYFYLETVGNNWDVGQIPSEYHGVGAELIPINIKPALDVGFDAEYEYSSSTTYVNVDVIVTNLGSTTTRNTKVYVALQTADTSKVWDHLTSDYFQIAPEESYTVEVTNLQVPTGRTFRIYIRAYGDNVISDEATSNWITWS